jgi:hypothetical protein
VAGAVFFVGRLELLDRALQLQLAVAQLLLEITHERLVGRCSLSRRRKGLTHRRDIPEGDEEHTLAAGIGDGLDDGLDARYPHFSFDA